MCVLVLAGQRDALPHLHPNSTKPKNRIRCYYGAENEDVERYGAFETGAGGGIADAVFRGNEHALPAAQRTAVPFEQLLREEAADVFRRYSELPKEEQRQY